MKDLASNIAFMRSDDIKQAFDGARADFYLTAPAPCPYLSGRKERKAFSFLHGPTADAANSLLTQRGFRRSQNIIYVPACEGCRACRPARIVVEEFEDTRSRRRIARRNNDLVRTMEPPKATSEQFSILRGYLDARHADGGMSDMTALDYVSMVEETSVDTSLVEYRIGGAKGPLAACALTDRLEDGVSMVYSFFEPDYQSRSLGAHMILDHVALARTLGLPYVYLGYWVEGSQKMDYKARFAPLEVLTEGGWTRLDPSKSAE